MGDVEELLELVKEHDKELRRTQDPKPFIIYELDENENIVRVTELDVVSGLPKREE